jgi:putative flavoprotein involved in K+ transport
MRFPRAGDVDVVVIGAGHAGLAMSRYLSAAGLDHVVLERGEIANSWRH